MAKALLYSSTLKDNQLDTIETTAGASAKLYLFDGATPTINAADAGTKVATLTLPANWMAAASGGSVSKTGTWAGTASGTGTSVNYFRIKTSTAGTGASSTTVQGTVGTSTASFDLRLDNTNVTSGQSITISTFTIAGGN